jgi:hypothetical protein
MSVLKVLRERVAPELNFLYTVPPADTPAGPDCGWHGAEHALHTFLVARLFGADAELCRGDYAVLSRFLPPLTSLERETKHAWCSVNGVAPIDLSLTFAFFGQAPQLRSPVVGEGRNGDWVIQYADDEAAMDESFSNQNELLYVEREIVEASAEALVENPGLFLPAGHDVVLLAQITWHCFACASGRGKSVRNRPNREDALTAIAAQYPNASALVGESLRKAAQS